jgi:tRNA threonylcarbamoyladenosine biosynthesis protein TsaB
VNFLAIDASTEACSVAIKYQNKAYHEFELCPQSHSLVLLPMIDRLLKKANCQLSDFSALIYGRGPGSFTGVRIGIGVAQGLAFSADLPTVGISTLQAMAQQAFDEGADIDVLVAIDARMSEVYSSHYVKNEKGFAQLKGAEIVTPPDDFQQAMNISDRGEYFNAGTGWDAYSEQLATFRHNTVINVLYPSALHMLALGEYAFKQGEALPAEQAQPVYVRDTVSWKKLPGRE